VAIIKSGATTDQWTIDPVSKAGRVTLYDSSGNELASISRYLGVAMRQDVFISANNSSTANINAGVTWYGTGESSLNVAGIQTNVYADQPVTIYVEQSNDNVNWNISDSWQIPSNYGDGRTTQATGGYYRVAVRNDGSLATTVTHIATALCPTVEALPRSLTSGGNLKVSVSADMMNNELLNGRYACSTFRTLGAAAATQNLFTLENPAASPNKVAIRSLSFISDSTVALATVSQQAILSKPAVLPTGGTVLSAIKFCSDYGSPQAIARGATASDGGVATAITAAAGTSIWQQFFDRAQTAAGWYTHPNYSMIPDVGADLRQLIIHPGESILVQAVTSVPATTHMICNCAWAEYRSI